MAKFTSTHVNCHLACGLGYIFILNRQQSHAGNEKKTKPFLPVSLWYMQLVIAQMMHWGAENSPFLVLAIPMRATGKCESGDSENSFQRVQQMWQKIKAMSHTSEEQCEEGKLMIVSCAWPLPNTSLPWGLIVSCKRAVSIMEINLRIVWFLPGAGICFRLLKNPSGKLSRVGNYNNKRISKAIQTVSRAAYLTNNNFQFKRVSTTYFSIFALNIYCAYTTHNSWWLRCKKSYLI